MVRPVKPKLVREEPKSGYYKPQGIPMRLLEEVTIHVEELEALRLIDVEGLYQEDAAKDMGVSRQTIQRMVTEARCKVAQALVEGKALRIQGGTYILREGAGRYRCGRCGELFPPGPRRRRAGWSCPSCDVPSQRQQRGPGEETC